ISLLCLGPSFETPRCARLLRMRGLEYGPRPEEPAGGRRLEGRHKDQSSFPIATAVSAMRLEKPHSLSYQATMRTNVPPSTLVWSMPKVAECGSWLRSLETSGALVQVTMLDSRFDLAAVIMAALTSS